MLEQLRFEKELHKDLSALAFLFSSSELLFVEPAADPAGVPNLQQVIGGVEK